jgi:hypothetical protein
MPAKTIWKFPITVRHGVQQLSMPMGAVVISAGLDGNGEMALWARVNPNHDTELRDLLVVGTGWDLDSQPGPSQPNTVAQFIGTITTEGFVWHVFIGVPNDSAQGPDGHR